MRIAVSNVGVIAQITLAPPLLDSRALTGIIQSLRTVAHTAQFSNTPSGVWSGALLTKRDRGRLEGPPF